MRHTPLFVVLAFLPSIALSHAAFPGSNLKIDASMIRFEHQPNETAPHLQCRHELVNPLSQDWKVSCTDRTGRDRREYGVHLWVTAYTRDVAPKLSYEVLYWVDDRTGPQLKSHGSTVWFHLDESAPLHSMSVGQFVDEGQASLRLELAVPKKN